MAKGIILAATFAAGMFLAGFAQDPFSQRNFPCQEDEALMFIDTPSKDRTGCVNLEEVN
jgi:hypothetical protein